MGIGDWVAVERRVEIFEYFDFLGRERGGVDKREGCETDVEEGEYLGLVGRGCGGCELVG